MAGTVSGQRIALTMGDPAGVGPELVAKTVAELAARVAAGNLRLVVIGSRNVYERTVESLDLPRGRFTPLADESAPDCPPMGFVDVGGECLNVTSGHLSAEAGQAAYEAVRTGVRLALSNRVDAICTAPISKEALNLAGHKYSGHTELLATLTQSADSAMMLVHGRLRVSHVSTHTALREVASHLTPQRLRRVVSLTDEALRWMGVAAPRIAVAALNPHCGENGLFGREDDEITVPTLVTLREEGFRVSGPYPGDTVFVKLAAGQFDAVVAMYHDQGHIPVKLLGFHVDRDTGLWDRLSGVNVTLGLPIVRTSVDHGTAFDIAGKGQASADSLIEAVEAAITLSTARSLAGRRGPS